MTGAGAERARADADAGAYALPAMAASCLPPSLIFSCTISICSFSSSHTYTRATVHRGEGWCRVIGYEERKWGSVWDGSLMTGWVRVGVRVRFKVRVRVRVKVRVSGQGQGKTSARLGLGWG